MNKAELITRQMDALQALRDEKTRTLKQIKASEAAITRTTAEIFRPLPQAENRIFSFGNLMSNGLAVYQGIRMGSSMVRALLTLFKKKR